MVCGLSYEGKVKFLIEIPWGSEWWFETPTRIDLNLLDGRVIINFHVFQ